MTDGENRRTVRIVVAWATLGGALYTILAGSGGLLSNLVQGAVTGACVARPLIWFDMTYLYTDYGERLRRASFPVAAAVKLTFYLVVIVSAIILTEMVFDQRSLKTIVTQPAFLGHIVFALFAATFVNFLLLVRRMLGRRALWEFVTGHYHRPRLEERVFLMIDLDGSTAAAERLGHLRFLQFLRQFFFDISQPILECEGDVYKYVGDEVIVTWPLSMATREANCVRCYFLILNRLNQLRLRYIESFGMVPRFHAALHAGPVVAGEIGDFKQEVAFVGDTINTAARVEQVCAELGRPFLATAAIVDRLTLPWDVRVERLGPVQLRGKGEPIELCAVSRLA